MKELAWLTKAAATNRELKTQLGTLVFLPWDVRENIYQLLIKAYLQDLLSDNLFHDKKTQKTHYRAFERGGRCLSYRLDCTWSGHPPNEEKFPIFELASYSTRFETSYLHLGRPMIWYQPIRARFASPTLQDEFDRVYLSTFTFVFTCPFSFSMFIARLSFKQQQYLRSIEFEVCNRRRCHPHELDWEAWVSAFEAVASKLDSLAMVNFRASRRTQFCGIDRNGLESRAERRRRKQGRSRPGGYKCALPVVEVVSKMLRRRAEGVEMAILDPDRCLTEEEAVDFTKVLSEDY